MMDLQTSVNMLYFASALIVLIWVFFKRCERNHIAYRVLFAWMVWSTSVVIFSALKPEVLGSPFDTWKRIIYVSGITLYFGLDAVRIVMERRSKLAKVKKWVAMKSKLQ